MRLSHAPWFIPLMIFAAAANAQRPAPEAFAQKVALNIDAKPVGDALDEFGRRTGLTVVMQSAVGRGAVTARLAGVYTPVEALSQMLAPTGLRAEYLDDKTVAVLAANSSASDTNGTDVFLHREKRASQARLSVAQADQSSSTGAAPPSPTTGEGNSEKNMRSKDIGIEEVVVTGTHIRGISPASPVITIGRVEIDRSGVSTTTDLIRTLPENFSGGNNPQVNVGNAPTSNETFSGGASPNLRGLGPGSTLTLVNGRRLSEDTLHGAVDISMIPLDAVERIEVVTDGSSAAYGSDAVAGVVNFILKRNFEGAQTSLSGARATQGGGFDRRVSQLFGKTWNSGGLMLNYEYDKQDSVDASQREFTSSTSTPYSLLPATSRNSVFLSGHQDIQPGLSLFLDGLFTSRDSTGLVTYPGNQTMSLISSVREYYSNGGVSVDLGSDWKSSAVVNVSGERASNFQSYLPTGDAIDRQALRSTSKAIELDADGPVFWIGSNVIRGAIGVGGRKETLGWTDPSSPTPLLDADRSVSYLFSEVNVPMLRRANGRSPILDVTFSGRYEHYSDAGGKAVPKIGIAYNATDALTFRASWGKSFRAPTLDSLHGLTRVYALTIPDPIASSGASTVLYLNGSNPSVLPETATSYTFGVSYNPEWDRDLRLSGSVFNIDYKNRIESFGDVSSGLTDPINAPLVTRNPSSTLQADLIAASNGFQDYSDAGYDPNTTAAVLDGRARNLAHQRISGVDFLGTYKLTLSKSTLDVFWNAAYLRLLQQVTPLSSEDDLAARTFNPPRFRARSGATWLMRGWSTTAIVNWIGPSTNTYVPELSPVTSWTTVDAQISYSSRNQGLLSGIRASLSIQNLFDRAPPFVRYDVNVGGLNYDSNNASPLGRFMTLQLTKMW